MIAHQVMSNTLARIIAYARQKLTYGQLALLRPPRRRCFLEQRSYKFIIFAIAPCRVKCMRRDCITSQAAKSTSRQLDHSSCVQESLKPTDY